jgi:hypothetical protein
MWKKIEFASLLKKKWVPRMVGFLRENRVFSIYEWRRRIKDG